MDFVRDEFYLKSVACLTYGVFVKQDRKLWREPRNAARSENETFVATSNTGTTSIDSASQNRSNSSMSLQTAQHHGTCDSHVISPSAEHNLQNNNNSHPQMTLYTAHRQGRFPQIFTLHVCSQCYTCSRLHKPPNGELWKVCVSLNNLTKHI